MSIRDRIGIFLVSRRCIDDEPKAVMSIMGSCVVVDIRFNYAKDCFEYTALSPSFDAVEVGQMAPTYSVLIEEIEGQHKVSFKRVSA